MKERLDDCVAHFRRFCRPTTVGAVAVSGNRVLGCDIFSDPVLLSRLWNKLLRSYGVDVLHRRSRTTSHLTSRDVRRFLDRALSARYVEGRTPGVGVIIGISGQVDGEALVWDREAVHVGLFGDDIVYRDPPRPIPLPRPRPYPREQSLWPKEP